jgi:chromosome partitioning protein
VAQLLSFANHKGGVGKTTSAVNTAAALTAAGRRVLLIDLDPQGSASLSLGTSEPGDALLRSLQRTTTLPVLPSATEGLDLVPAGPRLAEAPQRFTLALGADLLERCLKRTPGAWDWVLIDCPPSLGLLTLTALRASWHVAIPVEASPLALNGIQQFLGYLEAERAHLPSLQVAAVIPCRAHHRRRLHREMMVALERLLPGRIAPAVRENAAVAEAAGKGVPVSRHAPRSHGAQDYRALAGWLLEHLEQA